MRISSSSFPLFDVVFHNTPYSAAQSFLEVHYKSETHIVYKSPHHEIQSRQRRFSSVLTTRGSKKSNRRRFFDRQGRSDPVWPTTYQRQWFFPELLRRSAIIRPRIHSIMPTKKISAQHHSTSLQPEAPSILQTLQNAHNFPTWDLGVCKSLAPRTEKLAVLHLTPEKAIN